MSVVVERDGRVAPVVDAVREPPNDGHDQHVHRPEVGDEKEAPHLVRDEGGQGVEHDSVGHRQLGGRWGGRGEKGPTKSG